MRIPIKKLNYLSAICLTLCSCTPKANLEMPSIFSDNMVLQHSTNVAFWGKAEPGTKIYIETEWDASANTKVEDDSTWQVNVVTGKPGGPYMVTIKNGKQIRTINNVLLGEVWLGSGQSNMEMPLAGWPPNDTIENSSQMIATANNPMIRMFTVTRNTSAQPLNDVTGSWKESTPENAPGFSATAYLFAHKLHSELGIPVGIIHSSWGGTPAESWVSGKTLSTDPDFENIINDLKSLWPQMQNYNMWLSQHKVIDVAIGEDGVDPIIGMDISDAYCSNPELNTQSWPVINVPSLIEQGEIGEFDGAIWFRKEIEIPQDFEGDSLVLSLGPIDDRDITYFNGIKIGATEEDRFWQKERLYNIPSEFVKAGKAVIAVRVIDTQGGGGIYGNAELIKLYNANDQSKSISLAGEWKYMVVAEHKENKFYIFNPEINDYASRPKLSMIIGPYTPSTLYNAMIAPLVPYTIKGAIWYQGEANVGRSAQYVRLKSMLINDWRKQFKNSEMPFYFVQLAPYKYDDPESSSSAKIRDAQRRTLSVTNTGMVVTLDIGNVNNIHPAYKTEVGERLAFWALANNYDKEISFSGPLYKNFTVKAEKLIISFTNANGGLTINAETPNQFELAGEDGIFYPAKAIVENDAVILTSPKVKNPVNARYAYKNGSQASLFNVAGLPASTFTTEETLID